jgi:hypothetical protein
MQINFIKIVNKISYTLQQAMKARTVVEVQPYTFFNPAT